MERVEQDESLIESKFRLEHLSFIILVMTLIIGLYAFWQFEVKIWNRVTYRVGPWEYAIPFYGESEYPTSPYVGEMANQMVLLLIMSVLFFVSSLSFLWITLRGSKSTKTIGAVVIITGVYFFIAYWLQKSIQVSPQNWFEDAMGSVLEEDWQFAFFTLPGFGNSADMFAFFTQAASLNLYITGAGFLFSFVVLVWLSYTNYVNRDVIGGTKKVWTMSDIVKTIVLYLIMIAFFIYTIIPIFYTLLLSMSSSGDLVSNSVVPSNPSDNFIINYSSVIFVKQVAGPYFSKSFMISIILGFSTAIGGMAISLPAAYAISRFRFRGNDTSQFLVLATQMFPGIILLIPQFILWKQFGLLQQDAPNVLVFGVLLAYFVGALAYNVWMMKGYFDTLPRDLEEAALIDGYTEFGAFLRVAIPLALPGMLAVGMFTFLGAWNEFALAQVFIGEGKDVGTLPLMFYQYQDASAPDNPPFFQLLSAYSILAALPIIVSFMTFQRLLTGGLTTGGIK